MPLTDRYTSFLLRLQWAMNHTEPTWIVSLQRTKTGDLRWFPNLESLIAFLHEEFDLSKSLIELGEQAGCKNG